MTVFIFFGHSKEDYYSEYEKLCLEKIIELYPREKGYDIINPRDILEDNGLTKEVIKKLIFWEIEHKYFFPEILRSELVIVAKCWNDRKWRYRYTPGVLAEIKYAKEIGKNIFEFGT